jgi:hypothetical protein
MATPRTVDLLPEIFRTDTNRKFLGATLDQLTQEPNLVRTQGYVGRRVGPGVNPSDNYVVESTATRTDYQLEPGVVFLQPDTERAVDVITYPGMLDALNLQGAPTTRQDRLFTSEYYSWDPFCDLDKFTNYNQYYWLAEGPDSVDIFGTPIALTDSWEISRTDTGYVFSDIAGENPVLTLIRGGNYSFEVNQPGNSFWIQAAPGISGKMPYANNISSRDVLGVVNNGREQGTVQFNVPLKSAQDFYYSLPNIGDVDLVTDLKFNQINNVYVNEFFAQNPGGIDGITDLNGRTVIFTNTITDAESGGWEVTTQFDPLIRTAPINDPDPLDGLPGSFDSLPFDQTTAITSVPQRYSVWQIQYVVDNQGDAFMQLTSIQPIANLEKFTVLFGTENASTQWYKTAAGFFEKIPLLTAVLDTLWYQDGTNPEIFGRIKLVDPGQELFIDAKDIIGAKNYTSPNGVVFTNGLKVQFRGAVAPAQFQNLEYYVEGVGTGPGVDARVGFIDGEAYFGVFHTYQGRKMTGAVHSDTVFQQYIYDTIEESLAKIGSGAPAGAPLPTIGTRGANLGNGIKLLPVTQFVTPETYTRSATIPYDSTAYDASPYDARLNAPQQLDYITINRASGDRNAWARSNRWFHIDVITATAEYNNQPVLLDNFLRAKRPIVEFRAGINLYNFGTQGKTPVNVIDFTVTDAFSTINGQLGYSTDGYTFLQGSRVIFAADTDPAVRNQIWEVTFIDPNNSGIKIIDLVPVENGQVLRNQTIVVLSGNLQQGKSYWFDGVNWKLAQEKIQINQPPLFDVFDSNGVSFGNRTVYPSSTFAGSQLFGYAVGTGRVDDVLGFPLQYLNIDNVGDIVFENYLYTDSFVYVRDNVSQEIAVSSGIVRQFIDRVTFTDQIGWQTAAALSASRQVFKFSYNSLPLELDVAVDTLATFAPLQIFVEGRFIDPENYVYETTANTTIVTLLLEIPVGSVIEVQVLSHQGSRVGFYQVPINLENNPLNENSNTFTLGTIRTHYESIGQNLRNIQGPINGANNTRDLGNILQYGDIIIQNSAPVALTGVFLRQQQFELFSALDFNSQEYTKYKNLLLDLTTRGDFENFTANQILDIVLQEISLGRSESSPFYWSDMIPAGETYTENTYSYSFISTPVFDTLQTYNFTESNFKGLLVYLNDRLLSKDYEYTVSADSPTLTVTVPLAIGDTIKIREYPTTYGSYVPNTPTKMGLYPAFLPAIYVDESYLTPRTVIRGHDGSITVAFSDIRDQVLLEFETRIFNNIKIATPVPVTLADVLPGQFRTTDYTLDEINQILSTDFLSWVGWNKLDYTSQVYLESDPFTYNYSQSSNVLTNNPSIGAWRGIYNYFYDTYTPNTTPWEMLGFSEQPDWWQDQYGPAPYTDGNTVLWDDLAAGIIRDPMGTYVDPRYVRPELLTVLPVGSEGELLNPLDSTVGNFDATSFRRSWIFGDNGPVENTWRTSSSWPFAVMRLLALTKPANFFSLFADRDRYVYNPEIEQFLWDGRYRLDAKKLTPLYGNDTSKASYLNWIIDFNRQLGLNSTDKLTLALNNIDVRLCWRTGAFTDKKYLKILTERAAPDSQNSSLVLPDESYQLLLYKNQPFERIIYSSIVVQKTESGYVVLGYSNQYPYFEALASRPSPNFIEISAGNSTVRLSKEYSSNVVRVPYGFEFTNTTSVCDFLAGYGKLLEDKGLVFENRENGYVLNWLQMAQEFLYWTQQGWATGSIINLNPAATSISVERPQAVVDSINNYTPDNIILNQNRQALPTSELVIDRLDNLFRVATTTSNTINYIQLKFTAFEHIVVLDNRSIFSDLIYQPVTGVRQSRVLVSGWLSGGWTGRLNAPGFVLNQDNIVEWQPNRKYAKGDIVLFKSEYWSASTIIQPSQNFNYNEWIKSDYDQVQKGLLPNAANQSDQLATAYSVYDANLETEVDLFSYGLIGFRPREYMQALNLDDVSQVNLYQQFLKSKGTLQSAELFSLADLGKETAEYKIYEYWSILRSSYGATANRSYFELLLNQALLPSDPSLIQVIQPGQVSEADQTVLLQNVWKSTTNLTSPDILPTTITIETDRNLPSAGYANLDDVDITAFDLAAVENSDNLLNDIGIGTTIWVAKVNNYDWNVYRAELVNSTITQVSDNLEGRALVEFDAVHGLKSGDLLVIKFFNTDVNGIYRVVSVPSITTLLIDFVFTGFQTSYTGTGVGFTLQTARVAQASDVVDLPYARQLTPGVRIWVDNDGTGRWNVIEKTDPFTLPFIASAENPVEASQFGAAVAQGFQNLSALVGAPGFNPDRLAAAPGAVYTYVKTDDNKYTQNSILELNTPGVAGYGNSIDIGDQQWAVIGASASNNNYGYAAVIYRNPASNVFQQWQLLIIDTGDVVTLSDEFGYSVTLSQDERWIYVGAPAANRVYAYSRVDYQLQSVEYIAGINQNFYNYSNFIKIDIDDQLAVANGTIILTLGVDYLVTGQDVVFPIPPNPGSIITISRKNSLLFQGDNSTTIFNADQLYGARNEYSTTVYVDSVLQRPMIDYTVDVSQNVIFATAPAEFARIEIRAQTYYTPVATIELPGLLGTERFGQNVSTTTDGRMLLVGAPEQSWTNPVTSEILVKAGATHVFDRSVQNFQVFDATVLSYTTALPIIEPVEVYLNNQLLANQADAVSGDYSVTGNTVTINVNLSVGDIIAVSTNQFELVQTIVSATPDTNSEFGYKVDQCVNDCSLYIGAPFADSSVPESGQVEFNINQSRVYGTITSLVANPVLTPGDFIRVNNFFVENTGTTVAELAAAINAAALPNVIATTTPDVELVGDGTTRVFNVGSVYSVASAYSTVVYINDVLQTVGVNYTYNNSTQQITFTFAPLFSSIIRVVSGRLTLSVKNSAAAQRLGKLLIGPGTGDLFTDMNWPVYAHQQIIVSPLQQSYAHFGESIFISDNTTSLIIGAPNATAVQIITFDNNTTTFDADSVTFFDVVQQSGVVYTYDYLPSAADSVNDPAQFVFGQQIFDNQVSPLDRFGAAVDYTTGTLLIGAPTSDLGDSQANFGQIVTLQNPNQLPAWQVTRRQQPVVDVALLNTVYMYDRVSNNVKQYFDYFDPLQGRLLGAVAQNIDYIGAIDPAAYNVGAVGNYGSSWTQERVGEIWWNTSTVRFVDTNQDDVVYASRRWGQIFPGSLVQINQWIASSVPPAEYTGPGIAIAPESYVVTTSLNEQGIFGTTYYFWVTGISTVDRAAKKTLSIETITQYINSPKSSGISYVAPINASTVAIYNGANYISAEDTILHIEYDQQYNDAAVHVEYQLIPQDRADGFLSDSLYLKLQDSFCGSDTQGNLVPDPLLSISEQYGVQSRPRQSMFTNRFSALKNYLGRANTVLKLYPVTETRRFNLLNSEEPEPSSASGAWDVRVSNIEELSYQNLNEVPVGYRYLVSSDAGNRGLWTIYQTAPGEIPGSKTLELIRVQNYDTRQYWNYVDWYLPGYNPATRILIEVPNYSALDTINVPNGASVRVTANAQGKFEIYQYLDDTWVRVALEDGTIEMSPQLWNYQLGRFGFDVEVFDAQFFDQEPVIETRKIIQAINEELFVGDLLIERNRLLILMFNYILSEQQAPNWLTKTSLIDVDHVIRDLVPFQIYRRDNQNFVLNYIQEVKPYHVQIREFNLIYNGLDQYNGTVNDFDLPAFWDPEQNLFISPVLDNNGNLSTTSSFADTDPVWQTLPWNQWYQNYLLGIESVSIVNGGTGYTVPPEVVVTGTAEEIAVMTARINSAGRVVAVDVINPGFGYSTTATITLVGGNGTGAVAVAVMGNQLVRSINTTIKYDRYQYQSSIVEWDADENYNSGTMVRYDNRVWSANSPGVQSTTFNPEQWTLVSAADLSGVDRTMGFYVPTANQPGLDLALLISGVDYPGVQVSGPNFNQNTGFDVGNFDINPFDNIAFGPEGLPTYDPGILDAIYESEFTDPYLGTLPAPAYEGAPPTTGPNPIVVDGGAFVDTYSSHAPEELIPGAVFDTLDMRVFTTPGSDWTGNGHGFPAVSIRYTYDNAAIDYSFRDLLRNPVLIQVWNLTLGVQLNPVTNYTIDWKDLSIRINSGVVLGQVIVVTVYGLGGGNQLYIDSYNGADVGNALVIPVDYQLIDQLVVFVNGMLTTNYSYAEFETYQTRVEFDNTYIDTDYVYIAALGVTQPVAGLSWSTPQTQYFLSSGELSYILSNSLSGTNPANIIVEKNGVRARPPEGIEYIDDGSSLQFYLPTRGGYSQGLIADNDVAVYVNNTPLILGTEFFVDPWDGVTPRTITLTTPPPIGARILISVRTAAQYYLSSNVLIWKATGPLIPVAGDIISVTTWNDTSEQDLLTQVFVGPTSQGLQIVQPYDSTDFDAGLVTGDPGSFDYSEGTVINTNTFDTGRLITDSSRLEVALDGIYLFEGTGYTVNGTQVLLPGAPINSSQIVTITSFTQNVVPGEVGFRIFQDMRGLQSTYRIVRRATTQLIQPLAAADDIIYVADASAMPEPNLSLGLFGLITVDGERISYRTRNLINNTLSGLRRGTAGTAANSHSFGALVYDIGRGELLPAEYQNYVESQEYLANGTQTVFATDGIVLTGLTTAQENRAVEVYVGGILQTSGYQITAVDPVTVSFDTAPTANYQVTLLVRRGLSWYTPGPSTASNGIPLQEQQTTAARFIRGD